MRRLVTLILAAAIAVAGALPPHYAMAGKQPRPTGHAAAAHEHAAVPGTRHDMVMPCEHHKNSAPNAPGIDHPCCASACAAIAFIFTHVELCAPRWSESYSATPTRVLRAAPQAAADPPPRNC
jgi:hypothetical protein